MARALPYAGIDVAWEAQQLRAFQQLRHGTAAHASFADYLFGRLLEEDLHVSCMPMLPPNVDHLHGVTIQGTCILQIVDIVNIGANFEHRKDDAKGPTRTLKICFTDGHQLVFGFEARWLPTFSMSVLHGTKVVVTDVDVRHGLLLLTPQSCRLLGLSGNDQLEQTRKATAISDLSIVDGAYAAALKTTQFTDAPTTPRASAVAPVAPVPSVAEPLRHPAAAAPRAQSQSHWPSHAPVTTTAAPVIPTAVLTSTAAPVPLSVTPPVFVDVVSSDGDCDSDDTDPAVQHLFYSPNTPRIVREAASPLSYQQPSRPSRKRPRDAAVAAVDAATVLAIDGDAQLTVSTSSSVQATPSRSSTGALTAIELLPPAHPVAMNSTVNAALSVSASSRHSKASAALTALPFQYFTARSTILSAAANAKLDDVVSIRACIKSVAGFQFHTGLYELQVVIEDCSMTKAAAVDAAFVETLMGVPCLEFLRAMQKTPAVAHQWAARMQFALMTLEGVMAFRMNPNGSLTLFGCRDVTRQDARMLLQRVQMTLTPR